MRGEDPDESVVEKAPSEVSGASSEAGSAISGRTEMPGLGKPKKKNKVTLEEKQPVVKRDDFGDKVPPRFWEVGPLATGNFAAHATTLPTNALGGQSSSSTTAPRQSWPVPPPWTAKASAKEEPPTTKSPPYEVTQSLKAKCEGKGKKTETGGTPAKSIPPVPEERTKEKLKNALMELRMEADSGYDMIARKDAELEKLGVSLADMVKQVVSLTEDNIQLMKTEQLQREEDIANRLAVAAYHAEVERKWCARMEEKIAEYEDVKAAQQLYGQYASGQCMDATYALSLDFLMDDWPMSQRQYEGWDYHETCGWSRGRWLKHIREKHELHGGCPGPWQTEDELAAWAAIVPDHVNDTIERARSVWVQGETSRRKGKQFMEEQIARFKQMHGDLGDESEVTSSHRKKCHNCLGSLRPKNGRICRQDFAC